MATNHRNFSANEPVLSWPIQNSDAQPRTRPYYRWLQKCILSFIEQRLWKSGQRIPNEWDLAKCTGLNVNTVKKGLLNLVEQGYLIRIPKKGTFVAGFIEDSYRYIFYTLANDFTCAQGRRFSLIEATENTVAADTTLPPEFTCGQQQFRVSRRMYFRDIPVMYSSSWLSPDLYPNFDSIPLQRFTAEPLYKIFDSDYNIIIRKSSELLSAVSATEKIAGLLSIPAGTPLLLSRIISYTDNESACEYRESYLLTSEYSLQRTL